MRGVTNAPDNFSLSFCARRDQRRHQDCRIGRRKFSLKPVSTLLCISPKVRLPGLKQQRGCCASRYFLPAPGDVLVFPEVLNAVLAELVQAPLNAKKVLYCQAHHYLLFNSISPERIPHLGFAKIACQSRIAKGFLERVLGFRDVAVIPCAIDSELFFPRPKANADRLDPAQIAARGRIDLSDLPTQIPAVCRGELGHDREPDGTRNSGDIWRIRRLLFLCHFLSSSVSCRWKPWRRARSSPGSMAMADRNMRHRKTACGFRRTIWKKLPMRWQS